MLITAERSALLVIDLQSKLMPAIADHGQVVENVVWLMRAAQRIDIPVGAIEQNPKGLGGLIPDVRGLLPDDAVATKMDFSCVAADCLATLPGTERPQIVLAGVETHVCVMQTALELLEEGKEVYVVADCVGSRRPLDRDVALTRMRDEGVHVVTREMVVFEWLGKAGTPLFREVSREFLR